MADTDCCKFLLIPVLQNHASLLHITGRKIPANTLRRLHERNISIHDQFAVLIVSVTHFCFLQFQRNCILKNLLFLPEINRFIVPGIHSRIQHRISFKSQRPEHSVGLQISHEKALHPLLYPFSGCLKEMFRCLFSGNIRECQIEFFLILDFPSNGLFHHRIRQIQSSDFFTAPCSLCLFHCFTGYKHWRDLFILSGRIRKL